MLLSLTGIKAQSFMRLAVTCRKDDPTRRYSGIEATITSFIKGR